MLQMNHCIEFFFSDHNFITLDILFFLNIILIPFMTLLAVLSKIW